MKILHLNEHNTLAGGVEIYLNGILPELEKQGHEVHLIYGTGEAQVWANGILNPAVFDPFLKTGSEGYIQLRKAIEALQPDRIHIHNVQSPVVIELCLEFAPVFLTCHDFRWICPANTFFFNRTQCACDKAGAGLACFATTAVKHCLTPRPKFARAFYKRATWLKQNHKYLAGVIAPSEGARMRLEKAGWDPHGIRVIPYFCPLPARSKPRALPERKTLTFMGRVAPNKGWQAFIRAIGALPSDYQGLMIGNFDEAAKQEVTRLANELGCQERIILQPWAPRDELPRIFEQTSIFCFTSLWPETLGIVGLEAMSQGVPIIGSNIGGVPQWLKDDINGILVPPNDPNAIAEAALKICDGSDTLLKMGESGIEMIGREFLLEKHSERLLEFYQASEK